MRRAAAATLAALALSAGPAQAAPFNDSLNHAYRLATHYWGGGPIGCSSVDLAIVPNGSLGDAWGRATLTTPGQLVPCTMEVVRKLARPSWIGAACALVSHELGHLRGLDHSEDPANVMYPGMWSKIPGICWRAAMRWEP